MNKKLGLIAVIVGIAAALVIGGVFLYYNPRLIRDLNLNLQEKLTTKQGATADKTKDWKVYSNDKFGFLVKYPSEYDFKIRDKVPSHNMVFRADLLLNNPDGGWNYIKIRRTVYKNIDSWFSDFRDDKISDIGNDFNECVKPSVVHVEDMVINGVPAKKVKFDGATSGYYDAGLFFIRDRFLYEFSSKILGTESSVQKYSDTFNLILSTILLTQRKELPEWETYRYPYGVFEFTYPPKWEISAISESSGPTWRRSVVIANPVFTAGVVSSSIGSCFDRMNKSSLNDCAEYLGIGYTDTDDNTSFFDFSNSKKNNAALANVQKIANADGVTYELKDSPNWKYASFLKTDTRFGGALTYVLDMMYYCDLKVCKKSDTFERIIPSVKLFEAPWEGGCEFGAGVRPSA